MKKIVLKHLPPFFALILLLTSASLQAWAYRELESGLDYAEVSLPSSPEASTPAKLHLFRINLKFFKLEALKAQDFKQSALSAQEFREKSQALLTFNANFFDKSGSPLGLVLRQGKIENPLRPISWWASFLIKKSQARIQKLDALKSPQDYALGIQAGPRLVVQGKTLQLKNESSPKTAVGIDAQGRVVVIVSGDGVEINRLAQFLASPISQGGVGLKDALNLDGGASTQLSVLWTSKSKPPLTLEIPAWNRVPIALGLLRR